jgi:hypothetical protein
VGGRHLAELELKVSFVASDDMSADAETEVQLLEGPKKDMETPVDES